MCGIAGFLPRSPMSPERLQALVRNMANTLVHRGPDDQGEYVDPHIGLGARRLAIIDREHAHQPMSNDDGSLVLIYNGEIYNYRTLRTALAAEGCHFRTSSDTEVLLRVLERYGSAGIQRLEGMFAFALWNARERQLLLARDWLGQKSLYTVETPEGFAFASEIKALLQVPGVVPRLDLLHLSHYMTLRYLPGTGTLFQGVQKLPAGHILEVGGTDKSLRELWRPAYEPKHALDEPEILDQLDGLLARVVDEHLMSEVPLGAFLSGGIDSSLVVAYASRALPEPLTTFSVGVSDAEQNELPWARQIAERFHTNHTETIVDLDLAVLTARMTAALEEPVDPFGAGVYIVSEAACRQVTVALGGDGGDELFAGYDRYKGQALAELYALLPIALDTVSCGACSTGCPWDSATTRSPPSSAGLISRRQLRVPALRQQCRLPTLSAWAQEPAVRTGRLERTRAGHQRAVAQKVLRRRVREGLHRQDAACGLPDAPR